MSAPPNCQLNRRRRIVKSDICDRHHLATCARPGDKRCQSALFFNSLLNELAQMYNPCIRGWIVYYSHFYKTQLRPTLKRIDAYLIRWSRCKFKRLRHQTKARNGSTG